MMVQKSRREYKSGAMASTSNYFPKFSELPKELRLEIWDQAALFPRIVELSWKSKPPSVVSITATPPVLHTCREARYEVIGHFEELKFEGSSQVIFLHYSVDTILFGPGCKHLVPSGKTQPWIELNRKLMRDILSSSLLAQNLKVAAFDYRFLLALDAAGATSMGALYERMKNLEEVNIIRGQDWENAKAELRRSDALGIKFVEARRNDAPYQEAKFAHDLSVHRSRHSNIQKFRIANVEVLKRHVEKPAVCDSSVQHKFSIRSQTTFFQHRRLLKARHRPSSRSPHQPPSYSELST
jgi:hypothetical protein